MSTAIAEFERIELRTIGAFSLVASLLGPREGEETETGERGGGAGETKRLVGTVMLSGPRDGEETEEVQEGDG